MNLLTAVVLLPLAGAVLTLPTRGLWRAALGIGAGLATTAAGVRLLPAVIGAQAPVSTSVMGPGGLSIGLAADGLATAMVVMTCSVGVGVASFALVEDLRTPDRRHAAYWPLLLSLWSGLHLLFIATDLLTAYLMLEVVGLCGAALVTLRGDRGSLLAGARYFYAELAASTTMLVGVALVWWQAGTVVYAELGPALADRPLGALGLAIMTAGLLVKLPLAPLHFWLPAAHTQAPAAVSPLLSGVMVKAAFAVIARLWFLAVPTVPTPAAAQLLGGLGALAILWGSLAALSARPLKRLIAASTVAQLGLLFLMPPLLLAGGTDAWDGGVVLAVSHALAKAAMLMAAAVIVDGAREDRAGFGERSWPVVSELQGSAARRPIAVMAFGIGGLSLVGLPPSGGFVAKWYLLQAGIATGQWWWVLVIVVGTLLTASYLMRFIRTAFAPPVVLASGELPPASRDARDLVALALAGTTLVLGLRPGLLLEVLSVGRPLAGGG